MQEYAQRAAIDLPVYVTVNEGSQHSPQFRSAVIVDGKKFVSPNAFIKRKEAEQYAAKYALENILNKIKEEGIPQIQNVCVIDFFYGLLIAYILDILLKCLIW